MALLSLHDVSIAYGGPLLLDSVTLHIEKRERICVVGRNGEGKSTLMRIIHGTSLPDAGEVARPRDLVTSLLPQQIPDNLNGTVFEVVSARWTPAACHDNLEEYLDTEEGWPVRQHAEAAISRLRLDGAADFDRLSGGLKRRTLLACALAGQPDILLLDEPTNHLDIPSIDWLEEFLVRFDGAILFVTHDRAFLQKLATRIVELDRGRLSNWNCDYRTYLVRKQEALEAEATINVRFDRKLAEEEVWIRQGIKARRTRNEGRVKELKLMREERRRRRSQLGRVSLTMQQSDLSGELVIKSEDVCFGYDGVNLIRQCSTYVMRGDKIGIVGPNGCGKTTLLKLLLGKLQPDRGVLRHGTSLQTAYFDQHREQLDKDATLLDVIGAGSMTITLHGRPRMVMGYLNEFLFTPDRARQPVKCLSGGERNRLLLARLFTRAFNVLIMDEPTNDLDVETLELLEDLLIRYQGTLLLVSHDRQFLNNVVTSTLVFEKYNALLPSERADTGWYVNEYAGGYNDWLNQRTEQSETKPAKAQNEVIVQPRKQTGTRKLSNKERAELEALPERIEQLEAELEELHQRMADPAFYRQASEQLRQVRERADSIPEELEHCYERWETLEAASK